MRGIAKGDTPYCFELFAEIYRIALNELFLSASRQ